MADGNGCAVISSAVVCRGGWLRSLRLGSTHGGSSGSASSSFGIKSSISKTPSSKGFGIRGMTAEVAVAIRASSTASLDLEKTQAMLPKRKVVEESSENEEEENSSLIARPRARIHVIDGDEVEDTPARASISEPSGEFGPVLDETPFSSSIPSIRLTTTSISLPILSTPVSLPVLVPIFAPTVPALTLTAPIVFASSTTTPSIVPPPSVQHTEANLIGTELIGRISTLEKKDRESAKAISEARRIAKETQLEAANWKEQFENAQGTIEELISSDEIRALKSSHASLEASLDFHLAEHQILKNDLAMWEREYGLLEENFNIEVSWAFLKSRRDALMEATQENFDLQSELAKVLDTIEKSQQPFDTPSPALGTPGAEEILNEEVATAAIGVAIPAPEGETSMTQSMEAEAPVTLASLGDFNTPGPAETAPIATPSEVVTVPVTAPENEIATSD
uniref:Uncharacterized protein LOC104229488 n=1 Tax=Nicotiana sylvestris TaxID=4096 RepID=A0A1U7WKF5_NICSY